jgi:hypothetical protein
VYAFRGSIIPETTHRYILGGLQSGRKYRLRFHDHSRQTYSATGYELMHTGVKVALPQPNSSELIFVSTVD